MDEFHYFADPDRGSAWEVPLWRMTGPLSATTILGPPVVRSLFRV